MTQLCAAFSLVPRFVALSPQPASATTIERVISPGGIEAWLVQDASVPLIAMNFSFQGGATQDPEGKAGTSLHGLVDARRGRRPSRLRGRSISSSRTMPSS